MAAIPMTLSAFQGHTLIASLSKCRCAAADRISTDAAADELVNTATDIIKDLLDNESVVTDGSMLCSLLGSSPVWCAHSFVL